MCGSRSASGGRGPLLGDVRRSRRPPAVPGGGAAFRPEPARSAGRRVRSGCARPRRRSAAAWSARSSAPLPQSMPYRCRSAQLSGCGPASRRSCAGTCERPVRGAPPISRCPKEAKSIDGGPAGLLGGQVLDARTGRAARLSRPTRRAHAGTGSPRRRQQQSRAARGSHGLCCGGSTQLLVGLPDRLDQDRQVGDLLLRRALGGCGWLARPGGRACRPADGPPRAPAAAARPRRAAGRRRGRTGTAPARRARAGRRRGPAWTWRCCAGVGGVDDVGALRGVGDPQRDPQVGVGPDLRRRPRRTGRWVARIRWMPSERPRWAMLTRPVTKSGRSRTIEANSSMTMQQPGHRGQRGRRGCAHRCSPRCPWRRRRRACARGGSAPRRATPARAPPGGCPGR